MTINARERNIMPLSLIIHRHHDPIVHTNHPTELKAQAEKRHFWYADTCSKYLFVYQGHSDNVKVTGPNIESLCPVGILLLNQLACKLHFWYAACLCIKSRSGSSVNVIGSRSRSYERN